MYRPVRILALGFRDIPEQQVWDTVLANAGFKPDLILLPEAWLGDDYPWDKYDEVLKNAAGIAGELNSYLVSPLYRPYGTNSRNSSFLLDRKGGLAGVYDKMFPYWKEFLADPPCEPGTGLTLVDTGFGRVALSICFDVNFITPWREMEKAGAELVLWSSDYSAGRALQSHACTHHYYIVSATRYPDSAVCDISGDEILRKEGTGIVVNRIVLDLDRQIFHENFNLEKLDALTAKYPDITVEKRFPREQWFILASKTGQTSVRQAAAEFGMETLRDYLRRSGAEINAAWSH